MLISDQAKDLKIVLKAGAPSVLFYRWCTPGILHKSTVWAEKIIHVTIYVKKARVLRSNLTMFRPCYVWKYYEWFWEVLWLPRKSFIVWFTESVDRQISGMCGWARVTRILCAKHKNTSWVFSLGNFVLESLFFAQRLWILNLFSADTEPLGLTVWLTKRLLQFLDVSNVVYFIAKSCYFCERTLPSIATNNAVIV